VSYINKTLGSGGGKVVDGSGLKIVDTTTELKKTTPETECYSYGMFAVYLVIGLATAKVLFTK